jgi:hypothetical protein
MHTRRIMYGKGRRRRCGRLLVENIKAATEWNEARVSALARLLARNRCVEEKFFESDGLRAKDAQRKLAQWRNEPFVRSWSDLTQCGNAVERCFINKW